MIIYVHSKYREIQNANRAGYEDLAALTIGAEKNPLEPYSDARDTVNINSEALNGKALLDSVNGMYDEFRSEASRYHDSIMGNWQAGTGRNNAESVFEEFMQSADKYKQILQDVSDSIADAIKNYQM
jgi:hypothetical protein